MIDRTILCSCGPSRLGIEIHLLCEQMYQFVILQAISGVEKLENLMCSDVCG